VRVGFLCPSTGIYILSPLGHGRKTLVNGFVLLPALSKLSEGAWTAKVNVLSKLGQCC
jgi:hypothetical protein